MAILKLENVGYSYKPRGRKVLVNMNYAFEKGKIYAITGRSGSGKTTLLSLLSGLTTPTSGKVIYNGTDIRTVDRYKYRSKNVGVIFQSYNLLPQLSVLENIILSMDASGKKFEKAKKEIANDLLSRVDLDDELGSKKILHLSGGEQQRVAIARALSFFPDILLADEPTGNLDSATQNDIVEIFKKLAHQDQKCVIIVTHSKEVAAQSDEVFNLEKQSSR
ncbi:MAG: ATP-binding cassette domain-containing protein [Bifidobacteriaceae bacterium]|nr:ATP-binding cassette domain-containing protein [Bifidobacteriaceae bacterium]